MKHSITKTSKGRASLSSVFSKKNDSEADDDMKNQGSSWLPAALFPPLRGLAGVRPLAAVGAYGCKIQPEQEPAADEARFPASPIQQPGPIVQARHMCLARMCELV
jgi:hypothetical protein